jgi:cytochrome P450
MQRSSRNFVEPERFLPERFTEGYAKRTRRYAYAPFGISAPLEEETLMTEMKLLLAVLARRFDFVQEISHPIDIDPLLTLRPKDGLPIRVKARAALSAKPA